MSVIANAIVKCIADIVVWNVIIAQNANANIAYMDKAKTKKVKNVKRTI